MSPLLKISTPIATATFLVVGITGSLMFFHIAQHELEEMHSWFGLLMVGAVLLHIVRNWAAMLGYPKRGPALYLALGLAGVGAAGFLAGAFLGGEERERGGFGAVMAALEEAPLTQLAPIFKKTPEELVKSLESGGLKGVTVDATPKSIAEASQTDPRRVMESLGR